MLTQSAGRKQRMDVRHLMVVVLAVAGCSSKEEAPAAAAQDATMAPADRVEAATRIRAAAISLHTAPASPGSAVIAAAAKPAEGTFLTGERSLLSEGAMSVERFHAVVGSNRAFAQAVSQFEQDAARQPEAQDLTGLYRSAVTAALDGNTDVVSFACGYSLCLGEIRSRTEDGFSAWARSFGKGNTPPVYAFATAEYTLGRNLHSGRFVFSTDPAANGITTQ
ncbi:hypothetical protein [Stenotrophomonas indicatrix]|uniref:hypothetical protein n=1 Tax=Stenotrophomonas indicatrix TaxID=2045451 RepID=UPI00211B023B|nr:hypothetical protein [Stenotrophomonas indicatrix]